MFAHPDEREGQIDDVSTPEQRAAPRHARNGRTDAWALSVHDL